MDEKRMQDLDSFHSERDQFKEKVHQSIKEAKLEQLTNQKYKGNKVIPEDTIKYEQLREKARNLIAKAREGQFDEKSLKDKECDRIEEHSLSNLDASLFIPTNQSNKEKNFRSYRVKKVKDLPCLKKKLDSRLHDSWNDENLDNQLNSKNRRPKSSPIKSYYVNYELQDLKKELEKIDKEAHNLEIALRHAISKDEDKDTQEYYLKRWYESINKRNAALRREMQLNLLENEKNLNNRYELLNKELQTLVSIEESQKTDAQKTKEKLLLEELVEIVNKRSELVVHLDMTEQALKDEAQQMNTNESDQEDENKNCFLM